MLAKSTDAKVIKSGGTLALRIEDRGARVCIFGDTPQEIIELAKRIARAAGVALADDQQPTKE